MKRFNSTIFTIVLLLTALTDAQEKGRYEFETAYVEKTTTTTSNGIEIINTEKIYISDYGNKEARYKTEKRILSKLKKTEESKTVSIIEGSWVTTYDPDGKTGSKMQNKFMEPFGKLSEKQKESTVKEIKKATGTETKESGTEIIAGKKCNILQATSSIAGMKTTTKMWMYKNFVMKSESDNFGNKVVELVTVFKENSKIDPSVFIIPGNVKIREVKF